MTQIELSKNIAHNIAAGVSRSVITNDLYRLVATFEDYEGANPHDVMKSVEVLFAMGQHYFQSHLSEFADVRKI